MILKWLVIFTARHPKAHDRHGNRKQAKEPEGLVVKSVFFVFLESWDTGCILCIFERSCIPHNTSNIITSYILHFTQSSAWHHHQPLSRWNRCRAPSALHPQTTQHSAYAASYGMPHANTQACQMFYASCGIDDHSWSVHIWTSCVTDRRAWVRM